MVAPQVPPSGDLAHNTGMSPDGESNWRPFGSQAHTQSTEPHQPGLYSTLLLLLICYLEKPEFSILGQKFLSVKYVKSQHQPLRRQPGEAELSRVVLGISDCSHCSPNLDLQLLYREEFGSTG